MKPYQRSSADMLNNGIFNVRSNDTSLLPKQDKKSSLTTANSFIRSTMVLAPSSTLRELPAERIWITALLCVLNEVQDDYRIWLIEDYGAEDPKVKRVTRNIMLLNRPRFRKA